MHKVALWAGFGVAVRLWQLGIEMRPLFNRGSIWVYPVYASIGGSFGYWLMGVEQRQHEFLTSRRDSLLAKRKRRGEREGIEVDEKTGLPVTEKKGVVESLREKVLGSSAEEGA